MRALELRRWKPAIRCSIALTSTFAIWSRLIRCLQRPAVGSRQKRAGRKTGEMTPAGLHQALASKRISFFSLCPAPISLMRGTILFIVNVNSDHL
jgi:hypothetical protein